MAQRLAFVTGGNRGIGRACAEALLDDGHRVVVAGRDTAAIDRVVDDLRGRGPIDGVVLDVTDADQVDAILTDAQVDILVANAGADHSAPVHRTTLEDWARVIAVNATGVFLTIRAVVGHMRHQGWGRIVVVDSIAGRSGLRYGGAYAASKHAAVGLVRSVALEVATHGITANCVCPGFVETDMAQRVADRIAESTGATAGRAKSALAEQSPLRRLIDPAECAAAVAFLASDRAAAVNGQSLVVDGGAVQR